MGRHIPSPPPYDVREAVRQIEGSKRRIRTLQWMAVGLVVSSLLAFALIVWLLVILDKGQTL